MTLSILICSLASRVEQRKKLDDELIRQCLHRYGEVQVCWNTDNGEKTVGRKRNELLEQATGEYVCFIDDDDEISFAYVEGILNALKTSPNVVGLHGDLITGATTKPMIVSRFYSLPGIYHRTANHLNPVRRTLALQAGGFADISCGEDSDYSWRLCKLLKTEVMANPGMTRYRYVHDPQTSATHPREGLIYWNKFGASFRFNLTIASDYPGYPSLRINGHQQGSPYFIQRKPMMITVIYADGKVNAFLNTTHFAHWVIPETQPTVTVEVLADALSGTMSLLRLGPAVVGGREVILCHKRPS